LRATPTSSCSLTSAEPLLIHPTWLSPGDFICVGPPLPVTGGLLFLQAAPLFCSPFSSSFKLLFQFLPGKFPFSRFPLPSSFPSFVLTAPVTVVLVLSFSLLFLLCPRLNQPCRRSIIMFPTLHAPLFPSESHTSWRLSTFFTFFGCGLLSVLVTEMGFCFEKVDVSTCVACIKVVSRSFRYLSLPDASYLGTLFSSLDVTPACITVTFRCWFDFPESIFCSPYRHVLRSIAFCFCKHFCFPGLPLEYSPELFGEDALVDLSAWSLFLCFTSDLPLQYLSLEICFTFPCQLGINDGWFERMYFKYTLSDYSIISVLHSS